MATAAVLSIGLAGCSGTALDTPAQTAPPVAPGSSSTTTSPATTTAKADAGQDAGGSEYQQLLLTPADLSDGEDTFSERSAVAQPSGIPGASAFFVNAEDTRAISDTLLIYPDAETAASTLRQASEKLGEQVVGGAPTPLAVGNGVMISGTAKDEAKDVTLLYFTEGRALVRLEFQSALGDPTTVPFVTNVAKMQQIALRVGLGDER